MKNIKYKWLIEKCNFINKQSKKYGLTIQQANYTNNIYLIDKKEYPKTHCVIRFLYCGTKTELWYYLDAIDNALYWLTKE